MRYICTLSTLLFIPALALSATIYVPDDYTTIQGAIDSTSNGDEIIVRPGTYVENIFFLGKSIVLRSELGPESTIIDGGNPSNPDLGSVVNFNSGEDAATILTGFTITNGTGNYLDGYPYGGGIYCVGSSPTIVNNTIIDNVSKVQNKGYGGGIFCSESSSSIRDNHIINNLSMGGGGIACRDNGDVSICNNVIRDNYANGGGGITCTRSKAFINSNSITDNQAGHAGGGIVISELPSPDLYNNLIVGNYSENFAGGIECWGSKPWIYHCTLYGNAALYEGGGINTAMNASPTVKNSILWKNHASIGPEISIRGSSSYPSSLAIDYSDVHGGMSSVNVDAGCTLVWGNDMIESDPLFVDHVNRDFHLTLQSPCRDSGFYYIPGLPSKDFEGDPRNVLNGLDMGADEFYYHLYYAGEVIPGGNINVRVIGRPMESAKLLLGSGIKEPPQPTMYGEFYLELPISIFHLGYIPPNGLIEYNATVPLSWNSGEIYPFQAFVGDYGWPSSRLTNLLTLTVE